MSRAFYDGGAIFDGSVEVIISPYLRPLEIKPFDGKIYAGSQAAIDLALAQANKWVLLRTVPPTAMNRETGELVDLEAEPEVRCGRCGGWHG
jgi:hypothetical protein